jgi:SAM-dependent methyltransferase
MDREFCSSKGGYHFIPMYPENAISRILIAKNILKHQGMRVKDMRFLDAGCGMGNVMYYAYLAGIKSCTGIDFSDRNIAYGSSVLKDSSFGISRYLDIKNYYTFRFIKDNIITYEDYDLYDIIYFYCPLRVRSGQMLFVAQVADRASKGATIIGDGCMGLLSKDKRFVYHGYGVYQKIMEEDINTTASKRSRGQVLRTARKEFEKYLKKNS